MQEQLGNSDAADKGYSSGEISEGRKKWNKLMRKWLQTILFKALPGYLNITINHQTEHLFKSERTICLHLLVSLLFIVIL